jgi:hypothetical protein
MKTRRFVTTLATAAGGIFAAVSFATATATADFTEVSIGPASGFAAPELLSESGMPPFDQSFLEQGSFYVTYTTDVASSSTAVDGQLSTTDSFGLINQDLVSTDNLTSEYPIHSVVDILNFGNGFENVYSDFAGTGVGGTDDIIDTLITPYGDVAIPVSFDAAALPAAATESAAATDWAAALDADWTTLVTDFSALF